MKSILNKASKRLESLYKKAENVLFKQLPKSVGTTLAAAGIVAPIVLIALAYNQGLKHSHPSSFTVMITNRAGNSGGSGSVIETSSSESKILTNAHVCVGALRNGGKVRKVDGEEHQVTGYYLSDEHDLCLITVAADLKDSVSIASEAPGLYEEATVTGHPALMPNVISKGHFGGRMIVDIMTGMRKCTEQEMQDPKKGFFCMMFGGLPVIRSYESMTVTATIMPGSSGSAVLNSSGEISGVVFAGNSRGLSYAIAVPYESVRNFLSREMPIKQHLPKQRPWENEEANAEQEQKSIKDINEAINNACNDPNNKEKLKEICESFTKGTVGE